MTRGGSMTGRWRAGGWGRPPAPEDRPHMPNGPGPGPAVALTADFACQLSEAGVDALVRLDPAQVLLTHLGQHRVVRVADVAHRRGPGLADQLVGVEQVEPGHPGGPGDQVVLAHP